MDTFPNSGTHHLGTIDIFSLVERKAVEFLLSIFGLRDKEKALEGRSSLSPWTMFPSQFLETQDTTPGSALSTLSQQGIPDGVLQASAGFLTQTDWKA
jgi:hypothetical protein